MRHRASEYNLKVTLRLKSTTQNELGESVVTYSENVEYACRLVRGRGTAGADVGGIFADAGLTFGFRACRGLGRVLVGDKLLHEDKEYRIEFIDKSQSSEYILEVIKWT